MDNSSGKLGEELACEYLRNNGYKILIRNYEVHNVGEIDIAAKKNGTLYIIEVKTKKVDHIGTYGPPEVFITRSKMGKIYKTSRYLIRHLRAYDMNIEFWAISVVMNDKKEPCSIDMIEI